MSSSLLKYLESNIHHVYGKLGKFAPPYSEPNKNLPFATPNNRWEEISKTRDVIQLIRYSPDQTGNSWDPKLAEVLSGADKIFFMGFGFAPENIEKLGLSQLNFSGKQLFSTGKRPGSLSRKYDELLNHIDFTGFYCSDFTDEILLKRI